MNSIIALTEKVKSLGRHPNNPHVDWHKINYRYRLIRSIWKWAETTLNTKVPHPFKWCYTGFCRIVYKWTLPKQEAQCPKALSEVPELQLSEQDFERILERLKNGGSFLRQLREWLKNESFKRHWEFRQFKKYIEAKVEAEEKQKEKRQKEIEAITQAGEDLRKRYDSFLELYLKQFRKKKVKENKNWTRLQAKDRGTLLDKDKRLKGSYKKLPAKDKDKLKRDPLYRHQYAYVVLAMDKDNKPVDARVVRTRETLRKLSISAEERGNRLLLHPLPVKIPQGFWQKYRMCLGEDKAEARIRLIKEAKLIRDENIYAFPVLVLDVDMLYEEVAEKVEKVLERLGITKGYELGRTKSGNLRGFIYLGALHEAEVKANYQPLVDNEGNEYWEVTKITRVFHPKAGTVFRKASYLNRVKEFMFILYEMLRREGVYMDKTFVDRLNHPIWYSHSDKFYKQEIAKDGENLFYDVYRKAKQWQRENKAYEIAGVNLTKRFYPWLYKEFKRERKDKVRIPGFILNKALAVDNLERWKIAVRSLYEKYRGGTFIHFLLPSVGWAKDLNLDEREVKDFLMNLLRHRDADKTEADIEKAWRCARPLRFSFGKHEHKDELKFSDYVKKALDYIRKHGEVERQALLKDVFEGQVWRLEAVMSWLEKEGMVVVGKRKKEGTKGGRPSKTYSLPQELKEDIPQVVDTQASYTDKEDFSKEGKVLAIGKRFSHIYNNSPEGGASGRNLVVGGKEYVCERDRCVFEFAMFSSELVCRLCRFGHRIDCALSFELLIEEFLRIMDSFVGENNSKFTF